jgi:hypothetical protein
VVAVARAAVGADTMVTMTPTARSAAQILRLLARRMVQSDDQGAIEPSRRGRPAHPDNTRSGRA